jgi:cupin fold WbuC family metalloprotein
MIEKILYKKKLFALIVRKNFRKKKGINFFTSNNLNLQCGFMKHEKNHLIKPHSHQKRENKIFYTSEVLLILKGKLRVDFYNNNKNYLYSKIVNANDILILIKGSHGFKVLSPIEMLEIKQGPYKMLKDKIKFRPVNENIIKIK